MIYNKKNQKLYRLNNYLTNNNFNNIKIHLYKNHVLKKFDSVEGMQYMITSEDLLNHIHFKYEILYKDPVYYLIKFN